MFDFSRESFVRTGRQGGLARADSMDPAKMREIARKAIKVRWDKYREAKNAANVPQRKKT